MTLLYADGFEGFAAGSRTVLDPNYDFSGSIGTSEAGVAVPSDGNPSESYAFVNSSTSNATHYMLLPTGGLSSSSTWIVGKRFKQNAAEFENTSERVPILAFFDSEMAEQIRVYARAGTLSVRVGESGSLLGVADVSLVATVWYYLEVKVVFHASAGSITVRINENEVLDITGINTASTATGQTRPFEIGLAATEIDAQFVDDVYILDGVDASATQGQAYNDFLGDVGLKKLLPNGNGTTNDFDGSDGNSTDNYLLVDDDGPDSDTTYTQSATVNEKDLYNFASLSSTPAQIEAAIVKSYARKTDAGTRTFVHVCRSNGTEEDSDAISPNESYQFHASIYTEDPDTTDRWTASGLNAAEFGVKVAS